MTTYARIDDNGYAVDIVVTPPELAERFNGDWLARQTFIVVPDGTVHGAKNNGDGTFTNPAPPPPQSDPPPPPPTLQDLQKQLSDLSNAIAVAVPATAPILNAN